MGLTAGCGSGDPEPIVICEKDGLICEAQQYAPTKAHYGSSDVADR